MFPIKMNYKPSKDSKSKRVDVYAFHHTHDLDGVLGDTLITAWSVKEKMWITAPVWCFTPIDNKKCLKEGQ